MEAFSASEGPVRWEDIEPAFCSGRMLRHPAVIRRYRTFLADTLARGDTPERSILEGFFSVDEGACPSLSLSYRLFASEYPYWVEEDIAHLVMFASRPCWDSEHLKAIAIQLLAEKTAQVRGSLFDQVVLVNPTELRSVKGLAHAHVFVKDLASNGGVSKLINLLPARKQ